MKKITTLLLATLFMAIIANATVTVNVRTTTGDVPFLYVWNGAGTPLNGEWPGTLMDATQTYTTTVDGKVWFTQSFDADVISIIFNDGKDPIMQTDDINGVTGTAFFTFDPEDGSFVDVTSTYITDTGFDVNTLPAGVVYVEGKEFAYFVAPASWTNCNVWAWSTSSNFTNSGVWPGDPITLIGNTTDGNPVYQWIGPDIVEGDRPEGIIFNNGSSKTNDLDYVPGGVYNIAGKLLYTVAGGDGNIQLLEPVVTNNYIEFVGVNANGNYKFTLNTYEWEDNHGPQFQITIEPIDASKPAFFSQGDMSDPNYWEPMFQRVTQEMTGEAMTAQDNVKRLYLGDVQLLDNQFIDYNELHIVGFDLKNDYTLPAGCLLNAGEHMDEMDVKCDGNMTLSPNSLPADKNFVVTVYTQQMYNVWDAYKQAYNCQYILNFNETGPAITGVQISATVDGESVSEQLPASGFNNVEIEEPVSELCLNRFEVAVNIDVDEIFMDYAIVKGNDAPNGWTSIHATKNEDGKWIADNINLNILEGLESGQNYTLMFDFISGYVEEIGDRLRYDNGGQMYRVSFVCGNSSSPKPGDVNNDGSVSSVDVTALYNYLLNSDDSAIVNGDQDGDGHITSTDITVVYNIILGN